MERRPSSMETAATLRRHPELRITKGRVERLRRVRASCQKIACLRLVQLSFLMSPCHCLVTSGRIVKSGHMWIWIVYPAPGSQAWVRKRLRATSCEPGDSTTSGPFQKLRITITGSHRVVVPGGRTTEAKGRGIRAGGSNRLIPHGELVV